MRRYAAITVVIAAAVIGGGTAFGSEQQSDPTPTPSPVPASSVKDSLLTQCEQAGDQIRRDHPAAYVSDCNYGEGTVTIP
jgi:hypothetical protein